MQSFASLPPEDRWALAFHAGRFAYPRRARRGGTAALGERRRRCAPAFPISSRWSRSPRPRWRREIGEERAAAVIAYLRANPEALGGREGGAQSLAIARDLLRQSLAAYRGGDREPRRRARARRLSRRLRAGRGGAGARDGAPGRRGRARDGRAARRDRPRRPGRRRRGAGRPARRPCSPRPRPRSRPRRAAPPRPSSAPSPSCCARGSRRC